MRIDSSRTYVIAEAGVNHNGDVNIALELVEKATEVGADCVKFQTFKASKIVTKDSPKASYQLKTTSKSESQYAMLEKLELDHDDYVRIFEFANSKGIDCISTPYNFEDVDLLVDLNVSAFKIASGQLTELPFLEYVASKNRPIILSTGMADMSEVFKAVEVIKKISSQQLYVLQCTTNYPSKIEDSNINAMLSIKEACKVEIGYSDHVPNNYACFAAVALGAKIIEKHFTLDKTMEGPDHSSSLNPDEFKNLIHGIQQVAVSLGSGIKTPSPNEIENIYGMKRSLVATEYIPAGTTLKMQHIAFKRPMNGLSPNYLNQIIGKETKLDIATDEPIQYSHINW